MSNRKKIHTTNREVADAPATGESWPSGKPSMARGTGRQEG